MCGVPNGSSAERTKSPVGALAAIVNARIRGAAGTMAGQWKLALPNAVGTLCLRHVGLTAPRAL